MLIPEAVYHLTSRAETNWRGRSELFMSGMLVSRSYRALAMLVSISDGFCLDGLLAAILLREGDDILAATSRAVEEGCCRVRAGKSREVASGDFGCGRRTGKRGH